MLWYLENDYRLREINSNEIIGNIISGWMRIRRGVGRGIEREGVNFVIFGGKVVFEV